MPETRIEHKPSLKPPWRVLVRSLATTRWFVSSAWKTVKAPTLSQEKFNVVLNNRENHPLGQLLHPETAHARSTVM